MTLSIKRLLLPIGIAFAALLWAATNTAAQVIDVQIRNQTVVTSTQLTFEIWMRAGTGYVTQTGPYNAATNPESNGAWTGMTQRYDFTFADPAITSITSTSSNRVSSLSSSGSSVVQAAASGYDAAIGVTFGRSSANTQPDLTTTWTLYTTITVNVNGGTIAATDQITPRFATPSAATSKWSNGASPGTNRSFNNVVATPLPVKLRTFTAMATGGHQARLSWVTANEQDVHHFEIERSGDGTIFDHVVGQVTAAGNSSSERSYELYDNAPATGMNYYRLKIADKNGQNSYSEVRTVRFESENIARVAFYPNPLHAANAGDARLLIQVASEQELSYTISDVSGKIVGMGNIKAAKGSGSYRLGDMSALADGSYYLTVKGAALDTTIKISKSE